MISTKDFSCVTHFFILFSKRESVLDIAQALKGTGTNVSVKLNPINALRQELCLLNAKFVNRPL
jgi:hypothetical protein